MNYGKKSASKKRNSLISRSSMMGKRAHVSFIRVLFIGLIALCVAVSSLGIGSIRGILANTPDVNEVDIMPLGYATFLYDCNGNQIRKLAAPNANRLPVSIDQIPEDLQHAVVAIEDERFYEHKRYSSCWCESTYYRKLFRGCKYHYPAASEEQRFHQLDQRVYTGGAIYT